MSRYQPARVGWLTAAAVFIACTAAGALARPLVPPLTPELGPGLGPAGGITQRWVGAQGDQVDVRDMRCTYTVPGDDIAYPPEGESAYFVYCDMHQKWPDGSFTQMVPQIERGNALVACDDKFQCSNRWLDSWYMQAQYIFSLPDRPGVYGAVGGMVPVQAGDVVTTHITLSKDPVTGQVAYVMTMASSGTNATSQLAVTAPAFGLNPNLRDTYTTAADPAYHAFMLGDLWESWGLEAAANYPDRFAWDVRYNRRDG